MIDSQFEGIGKNLAGSVSVSVTAGAANVKGAWLELVAASARDAHSIVLEIGTPTAAGPLGFLIDIGIGAGGSEQIIIPNLFYDQRTDNNESVIYVLRLKLKIPAGSRVAARVQCGTASRVQRISAQLVSGVASEDRIGRVYAYGVDTATSRGTQIDPGATVHTKGAWAQLVASSDELSGLFMVPGHGPVSSTINSGNLADIGIGAAGSELVIVPNIFVANSQSGDLFLPAVTDLFRAKIPAGSRLAVRAQSTNNSATERQFDVALYGVK